MADATTVSNSNEDERIAKRTGNGSARADRASSDRASTQDRDKSDLVRREERRALLRDTNTLLPDAPEIPGYHLFWATTTNQKDSIEVRQRRGYTFVTRSELPGFMMNSQKDGELTTDRIMVNEMVLMKINREDWESDMMDVHYHQPLEYTNNLKNKVHTMQDGRGQAIGYTGGEFRSGTSDGFDSLARMGKPTLTGIK